MAERLSSLHTDFYQLTMMQGYWRAGLFRHRACFDLFFRHCPFSGGFAVAAGLPLVVDYLQNLRFAREDLSYLRSLKEFDRDFLQALTEFRFEGEVCAIPEGSPVFPMEPILRVTAPLPQCQLIESALLNLVNFQTLIATKAARVCQEAGPDRVLEFGLRRAQGPDGALSASRAAYLGGCVATSNVLAGRRYGIPVRGTHAHSWVAAFPDELTAFRAYAESYPEHCVLLVDTYDTLKNGVPNAIRVGLEMKARGQKLQGIRLDSGDLAYLSIEARRLLDEAGLSEVQIACSSDLDEYLIRDLKAQGARIDLFGVGTNLVAARGDSALSGVYKMAAIAEEGGRWRLTQKVSEKGSKLTLPGLKQVWRLSQPDGIYQADLIELDGEQPDFQTGVIGYHPQFPYQKKQYAGVAEARPILEPVLQRGKLLRPLPSLKESRRYLQQELAKLHPSVRRLVNPHSYKVSVGQALQAALDQLRAERDS